MMFIKNIFLFACKHSPATLTVRAVAVLRQNTTPGEAKQEGVLLSSAAHH